MFLLFLINCIQYPIQGTVPLWQGQEVQAGEWETDGLFPCRPLPGFFALVKVKIGEIRGLCAVLWLDVLEIIERPAACKERQ